MNASGEFCWCSGCGEWVIWTAYHTDGPVYCCDECARGFPCACVGGPDRPFRLPTRRTAPEGGRHASASTTAR